MKIGVATYYFDVLRLTIEYLVGENSFCFSQLIFIQMFWLLKL